MSQPVLSLGKDNLRHTSIFDIVPNAQMLSQLIDMGFVKDVSEQALIHTKNKNLQVAMDWLFEHPNGVSVEEHKAFVDANTTKQPEKQVVVPTTEVTMSEVKPQPQKHEELHIESRYAKIEEEKRKHREKQRQMEAEKIQREKKEKQLEKEKVLKRMQEDKESRKKQQASPQVTSTTPVVSDTPKANVPVTSNCILQIRLPSGQVEKANFKSDETLKTVHNYICKNFTHDDPSFLLLTTFPKREFRDKDMGATLQQADLAPRGTLVVQMIADRGVIKRAVEVDESTLDTDNMSYEQLLDLEDKIGTGPTGASSSTKQILPTFVFDSSVDNGDNNLCLICQCEYETGDTVRGLFV